ncbi:unnamed protein product [Mytilus coruscus]|uniref:Integrase zinc-binding domain-containing protein n=1 Tax=Mytilus coruscus TaxID=42192 RepID=A0A6J8ATE3_MYTCO|nr:unnamed protein product [Mytilus coruscus]
MCNIEDTGNAQPIKQMPRRLPLGKPEIERQEVQKMLKRGIIEPSQSCWSSPIVLLTRKSDNSEEEAHKVIIISRSQSCKRNDQVIITDCIFDGWDTTEIRQLQLEDSLIGYILEAKDENSNRPRWNEISHHSSLLILPASKHNEELVLRYLHDTPRGGHLGVEKTLDKVWQAFYWPNMKESVQKYCTECDFCTSRKHPKENPTPMGTYIVGEPMEKIAIDILGPLPLTDKHNKYLLVVHDFSTKEVTLPLQAVIPTPCRETDLQDVDEFVETFRKRFQIAHEKARKSLKKSNTYQKRHLRAMKRSLHDGQAVWVYEPTRKVGICHKLTSKWKGPYIVTKKIDYVNNIVKKYPKKPDKVFHIDRLIEYKGNKNSFNSFLTKLMKFLESLLLIVDLVLMTEKYKIEQCWLCTERSTSRRELKNHLSTSFHDVLRVACQFCYEEETTCRRIVDLKKYAERNHPDRLKKLSQYFFSENNGFWLANKPDDYRKIINPSRRESTEAKEARLEI